MTGLLRRAARFEAGTWRALARWVTRRPDVPPGATPFAHHGAVVAPVVVLVGLSVLEVVAVDVLVPWPAAWLRVAVLALGVWAVALTAGQGAAAAVHPHLATADGLRVRAGAGFDLAVPWDAVADVRSQRHDHAGVRAARVDGDVLSVGVAGATTVAVTLNRPLTAVLPAGPVPVTAVRLHADDVRGFVSAVRAHRPARR